MTSHGMPGMTPEKYREMKAKRNNATKHRKENKK